MKKFCQNLMFAFATILLAVPAMADDGSRGGMIAIGAGIAIAVAALGGAIGQGMAAASALEGAGRNPAASGKLLLPLILSLALIESLVIYALVIAIQLAGKV